MKLSDNELKVLNVFNEQTDNWGESCLYVRHIIDTTKLEEKEVRKICKRLRELKLIEYMRGLMDEEGQVAGSGYCITYDGQKLIFPCQKCGELAHYSWYENEKGEMVYLEVVACKYYQLCEEHYREIKK